jgi:LPXTG-motif cell wall-anchored protein
MNWSVLIIVGIALIALLVFLILRNKKDKADFEQKIKEDYKKSQDRENENDTTDPKI